jgi:pimeloyl-ACP methyl ester carboxylesterase
LTPVLDEKWRGTPTTFLLGVSDSIMPVEQEDWLPAHIGHIRIVDGDHFLPLLQPDLVSEVIAETFKTTG